MSYPKGIQAILFFCLACMAGDITVLAQGVASTSREKPVRLLPEDASASEIPAGAFRELESYWANIIREDRLPGVAVGVVQTDGLVREFYAGYRNVRQDDRIDANTIFNAGKATLAFTTLMGATGDSPNTPVFDRRASTVSPLFRMTDPRAQENCLVRDLLAMNAGAPPYTDKIFDPQWARPEDVFALLGQAPVMSPPGKHYRPSDISATVGGYLTAMVIGHNRRGLFANYVDVMNEHLMTPLGMKSATFTRPNSDNVATGHLPDDHGFNPFTPEEPAQHPLAPLMGLHLSMNDAARWIQTELSLGVSPTGERVAPRISVLERWQPEAVRGGDGVGMGWRRIYHEETEILIAEGQHGGQTATIGLFPAYRTGFAVFINAEGDAADRLADSVAFGLADALKETRRVAPPPSVAQEAPKQ
ncbi:MAG: serine hydrolase domain-containing protein [Puniceicoccales bacterium]